MSTREALAAGGGATGGVEGPQAPQKIAHFRLENALKMHFMTCNMSLSTEKHNEFNEK